MDSNQADHITLERILKQESGKLISVLTRIFGSHNLELAEDVVQDTLVKAMEQWNDKVPENPTAWLFVVAKNKVLDVIRQQKRTYEFAKDITLLLESEYTLHPTLNELLDESEIKDDQLRMMFACCHPELSEEAQVTLILKTLCGFSTAEIARAYLSSEETITKRLYRTRQLFREGKIQFEIPAEEDLPQRLEAILTTVYLIFNEGYNSTHHSDLIRQDLVEDAMFLIKMLSEHPVTNHPKVLALMALMCFHAARIPGRLDENGNILLLKQQNRHLWNQELIWFGKGCLDAAAEGGELSRYHLEAGIAYEHSNAETYDMIDWDNIVYLYNLLYQLYPSPIVALNRAIAIGETEGARAGLEAIEDIPDKDALKEFYLFPATLGEFYKQLGQADIARTHLEEALSLTQSEVEKSLLRSKIAQLSAD
ncbi:RNA polymerase sigma factor [Xanthocytophaga agilis]|uniref:RNA polymerase sigma factor n=1 Tax=Xanthocytophaga agilis TaxID=3048010 RepID=A0AAE3UJB5_9BACT|nr:sigma-70 family RNA polymerase sigma factor [Xanthocytophaga agilis]MDJ1506596.1 sigma-70 family RNA polymerase sigma factor [Xanthocytophaga agilis]